MEPARQRPSYTLLQGVAAVRDHNMSPDELKKQIDATAEKKGIIGRIVSRIFSIFRTSDAKKADLLEKKIKEFDEWRMKKLDDIWKNADVDDLWQTDEDDSFKTKRDEDEEIRQFEYSRNLEYEINTLMAIPSVKRLYMTHEFQRAVADSRAQLEEILEEIAEANADYTVFKEESSQQVNALINDIAKLRKEVAAKEPFARVLELDKKIEEWTKALQENTQHLKQAESGDHPDIKHPAQVNRIINNIEKAKAALRPLQEERKQLAEALTVETSIEDKRSTIHELRSRLEFIGFTQSNKPEELESKKSVLKTQIGELEGIVKRLAAERGEKVAQFQEAQSREYQDVENVEREARTQADQINKKVDTLRELEFKLLRLPSQYKESPELLEVGQKAIKENIDALRAEIKQDKANLNAWAQAEIVTRELGEAEKKLALMKEALDKTQVDVQVFEMTKNSLINIVEDLKHEIEADRAKRSPDFYGGLSDLSEEAFHSFSEEVAEKYRLIEALQKKLDALVKTEGMPRAKEYKPTYGELLPVAQKEFAKQHFVGVLDHLDEAIENIEKFEEAVRGTEAHRDVLQLLKELEAAKKKVPYDVAEIVKEELALCERRMMENNDYIVLVSQQKEEIIRVIDGLSYRKNVLQEEIGDIQAEISALDITGLQAEIDRLKEEKSHGSLVDGRYQHLTVSQQGEWDAKLESMKNQIKVAEEAAETYKALIGAKRGVVREVETEQADLSDNVARLNRQLESLDQAKQSLLRESTVLKRRAKGLI